MCVPCFLLRAAADELEAILCEVNTHIRLQKFTVLDFLNTNVCTEVIQEKNFEVYHIWH